MFPIAESFRICIQVMALPQFPLNVLGSVLARNRTEVLAPISPGDKLIYRCGTFAGVEHFSDLVWDFSMSLWRSTAGDIFIPSFITSTYAFANGRSTWSLSMIISMIISLPVITTRCEVSPDLRTTEKGDMEADLVSSASFPGVDVHSGHQVLSTSCHRLISQAAQTRYWYIHRPALRWEACVAEQADGSRPGEEQEQGKAASPSFSSTRHLSGASGVTRYT
jgi:hypothetical protein